MDIETQGQSAGQRLDPEHGVEAAGKQNPVCLDSGAGFKAGVQRCAKAAIQLHDPATRSL